MSNAVRLREVIRSVLVVHDKPDDVREVIEALLPDVQFIYATRRH
jgi:hypothetical protein